MTYWGILTYSMKNTALDFLINKAETCNLKKKPDSLLLCSIFPVGAKKKKKTKEILNLKSSVV